MSCVQVHLAYAEAGGADPGAPREAWPALARAFEAFLLGADSATVRRACCKWPLTAPDALVQDKSGWLKACAKLGWKGVLCACICWATHPSYFTAGQACVSRQPLIY